LIIVQGVRLRIIPEGRPSGFQFDQYKREQVKLVLLAVLIGILSAIVAVLFRNLIIFVTEEGFDRAGDAMAFLGPARFVILPALGGLIVGPLIYYGAREARAHGIPEVIDSVTRFGGRLRVRTGIVKGLSAAITLGSGGSAGREGPIVHIGSTIGSNMAHAFNLTQAQMKILLGCGAAAAIAATFNTPIAGVLFAIELILMEFKTRSFVPLVIASVIATLWAPGFDALLTGSWLRTLAWAFFAASSHSSSSTCSTGPRISSTGHVSHPGADPPWAACCWAVSV
jgi:H+/Cl- antiporter ClcA